MKDSIRVKVEVETLMELFEMWLNITKYLHNLTPVEIKVLAAFLWKHHILKTKINDTEILNEYLFKNADIKKEIETIVGFDNPTRLPNVLTAFRNKNVLKGNTISSAYIPKFAPGSTSLDLVFNIEVNGKG